MIRYFCYVLLLAIMPWKVYAGGNGESWNFKVYLDEKPVGFHTFTIDGESKERALKSVARFDVDFFIFNAYSYQHESNERWNGDCVDEINASTDDNGDKLTVRGKAEQGIFNLSTNNGHFKLPDCVMTFAYWNPGILVQKRLLNPQNGEYLDVEIKRIGQDTIKVRGENVTASHYRLKSEKFLIDLWYAPDRRWVALDSALENGRLLHYRIE
jgi:hypothetical protein